MITTSHSLSGSKTRYSVVGLGKLGTSMAACIASRGFDVIGVDVNHDVVNRVNAHQSPVSETGLPQLIADNRDRLRATVDHDEAIRNTDVTFVIVPTPSDESGAFSLQYAAWAFHEIGLALAHKSGYHLVVLTSTVLPGSTRSVLLPILERVSGKVCGKDFGLCYGPEFIALGSIIRDFLNPDFTLVGEFDSVSGAKLESCYAEIMINHSPCRRMSIENAELSKIALNAYITTKISYANMLADLCERIPGGNVDAVTQAIGIDTRIGRKCLTGGLGYGGPCFPRDNVALSYFAEMVGMSADIPKTTHSFNLSHAQRVAEWARKLTPSGSTVAVLGLAYKPHSAVIEESAAIHLAKSLSRSGVRVVAYDPQATVAARNELRDQVVVLTSVKDCLAQADVIIVANPDPEFKALTPDDFGGRTLTLIDLWRIVDPRIVTLPTVRYIASGCSSDDAENAERLRAFWSLKYPHLSIANP